MKNILLKGVLVIGFSVQALALSVSGAKTEQVSLRDGRTYNVPTQNGMPVAFKKADSVLRQSCAVSIAVRLVKLCRGVYRVPE